ncbi:MAG: 50S ribosomal protein L9 [Chitinivibrionales bacterium]|nr:50S ribosomal protein L9 [Chitinivibrionales bacterium]MBD3356625.1 50S ribosomal protein L9 [Chitinivibrionales bacterium]
MEVVLKKDHERLGKAMDVITVKDGYARNFLIPAGVAVPATEGNRRAVAEARRFSERREEKKAGEAQELAKRIENIPCTIPVKVKDGDQIYGSVSGQEIAEFLKREGIDVEKRAVELEEPIKQLGVYIVEIRVHKKVTAKLKVWVVKEEEEKA